MAVIEGDFVWYELMTGDVAAARAFYAKVVGWDMVDEDMPDQQYILAKVGDRQVAGLMGIPPLPRGGQPGWFGYVAVSNVDAMAERVKKAGGFVHRKPADIQDVGRFAVVADPHGAAFMVFRGGGLPAPDLAPGTPGAVGWRELHARDWQNSFGFYQSLFGWQKADAVDMGALGIYQTFSVGGVGMGGMMNSPQAGSPFWLYYFNVDQIDSATRRVIEHGGQVSNGPLQVPGGLCVVQASDPQGIRFALIGPQG